MPSSSGECPNPIEATAIPSSRNKPWARVMVVLAMITDGTLTSSGSRSRSSHAFTPSPPSAAVGVTRLKDSPTSRVRSSTTKGTWSRRKA
jgi:hypothetical protein